MKKEKKQHQNLIDFIPKTENFFVDKSHESIYNTSTSISYSRIDGGHSMIEGAHAE